MIFPQWLHLRHISDGFQIFQILVCSLPIALISYVMMSSPHMHTAEIGNFSVTINRTEQEGGSLAAILAKIRKFKPLLLGIISRFKTILLVNDRPHWYLIYLRAPAPNSPQIYRNSPLTPNSVHHSWRHGHDKKFCNLTNI